MPVNFSNSTTPAARNLLCCLAFLLSSVCLTAQIESSDTSTRNWILDGGFTLYDLSDQNGWGSGVIFSLERRFGRHLGLELTPGVILSSDGFYNLQGVTGDLGVSWGWYRNSTDLSVQGGISALGGGDSDGSILAGFGLHGGVDGHFWLTSSFGINAAYTLRLWLAGPVESGLGRFRQSVSGGVSLRF